jgi:Rieske Fe-S protein
MAAADNDRPEGADAELGRRVLLRGMAAMGLAAVTLPLAACGNDDEPEAVSSTPEPTPEATVEASPQATAKASKSPKPAKTAEATPKPTKTAEAEATPTPKATPKETTTKKLVKASNTPLAATTDIPVNKGMLFETDEYIVTQPTAGKFVGFDSLCTHEGCPVDVFDTPGEMDCSCHDSHFKITDGSVISGPAKKPMPKKPIIVENGQIYKAKEA